MKLLHLFTTFLEHEPVFLGELVEVTDLVIFLENAYLELVDILAETVVLLFKLFTSSQLFRLDDNWFCFGFSSRLDGLF